jgi:hypothetical protein
MFKGMVGGSHLKSQLLGRKRMGGSLFETSLGKKLTKPPSQSISQTQWHMPVIPSTQEAISRRIAIPGQLQEKLKPCLKSN